MSASHEWTFFTNHAHVMICLARNPKQPLREVALSVGITERAVLRIVADLEDSGYLKRQRNGRQNNYVINPAKPLSPAGDSRQDLWSSL